MPFSCFYPVSWARLIPTLRKMYRSLFSRNDDEFLCTPCVWWFAFVTGVNVGAKKGSISSRANNEHSRSAHLGKWSNLYLFHFCYIYGSMLNLFSCFELIWIIEEAKNGNEIVFFSQMSSRQPECVYKSKNYVSHQTI